MTENADGNICIFLFELWNWNIKVGLNIQWEIPHNCGGTTKKVSEPNKKRKKPVKIKDEPNKKRVEPHKRERTTKKSE
ncbi:hypothetical protein [Heyndrickxia oleronia]|uniref:hypothetical protein n=1 Tax=Heyndrickxia oleronia TaxID=38875 RepID=UPI001C0EB066|nr:hypothetical protein [Heyndrickxia oleronia]MBU5212266.1 hypothetical protein [Heyndrickxia oleronia]